jgi:hypothetical protein
MGMNQHSPAQQPALVGEGALQRIPERQGEQQREGEAQHHHEAEGPEQRRDLRHGVVRGLGDLFRRGLATSGLYFFSSRP